MSIDQYYRTYLVHIPNYHASHDWHTVSAHSAYHAAEMAAEDYDNDEHPMVKYEQTLVVYVKQHPEEVPRRFVVRGETQIVYDSEEQPRTADMPEDNDFL